MAAKQGIALQKAVALAAATPKTVLQLVAAANHGIEITEVSLGFDGTDNTKKSVLVELVRQTTAGTMTALTIADANDAETDTFDTTAQHSATAEPTGAGGAEVMRHWRVHPQGGGVIPIQDLAGVHVKAGGRIGLRLTADSAVNVDPYVCFTE